MTDELITNDKQAMNALKQHGGNIVTAVLVVVLAFLGWQFYQKNYAKIDTQAADLYMGITNQHETARQTPQATDVKIDDTKLFADIDTLATTHGQSVYAWQALMLKARMQADKTDYKGAIDSLQKAKNIPIDDDGLNAITTLQLMRTLLANNEADNALQLANKPLPKAFEATRQEILGDIYVAKSDTDNAKTAYNSAWELLKSREENRSLLRLKMQALGLNAPAINKTQIVAMPNQIAPLDNLAQLDTTANAPQNTQKNTANSSDTPNNHAQNSDIQDKSQIAQNTAQSDTSQTIAQSDITQSTQQQ